MSFFGVQCSASVVHVDMGVCRHGSVQTQKCADTEVYRHGSVKPKDTQAVEVTKISWEVSCSLTPAMVLGRRETVILEVATELGKSKEQGEGVCLPVSRWDVFDAKDRCGQIWECVCHGGEPHALAL